MFAREFGEGEGFSCAGNEYTMLLPREVTNCCEVALENIAPGHQTPPNAHRTFHQVLIVWQGTAEITIGSERSQVQAPAIAYVPPNTHHSVKNVGSIELQYLYVSIWSAGIPSDEMLGGWKRACADMIQEYAARGFPPKTNGK